MRFAFTLVALAGIGAVPAFSQPAPVVNIIREAIKEGRTAAHEKVEADYAAAFRKANHPGHYVALSTMSGPGEVWFIQPMPSFAAQDEYDKASETEPLKSALALVEARDGELRQSSRTLWAVYRPDLSYRAEEFNGAKVRRIMAGTFRVRLGHDDEFMSEAKTYFGGFEKGHVDQIILTYQVVAGAPSGTYLFFTMMDSMKALDGAPARSKAMRDAMGEESFAKLMKGAGDTFLSIEDTLLQVKPSMSYAPQPMVDQDPGFWKPKAMTKPAGAPPPPPAKKAAQ